MKKITQLTLNQEKKKANHTRQSVGLYLQTCLKGVKDPKSS